jgi:hypothetical protein
MLGLSADYKLSLVISNARQMINRAAHCIVIFFCRPNGESFFQEQAANSLISWKNL